MKWELTTLLWEWLPAAKWRCANSLFIFVLCVRERQWLLSYSEENASGANNTLNGAFERSDSNLNGETIGRLFSVFRQLLGPALGNFNFRAAMSVLESRIVGSDILSLFSVWQFLTKVTVTFHFHYDVISWTGKHFMDKNQQLAAIRNSFSSRYVYDGSLL